MKIFNNIDLLAMAVQLRGLPSVEYASANNSKLVVVYHRYIRIVSLINGPYLVKHRGQLTLYKNGHIKYSNTVKPTHDLRHALKRFINQCNLMGLDFGQALNYLKNGYKIARKNWGGYWYLARYFFSPKSDSLNWEIVAKCKDGSYAPAQAYQRDMLANDWKVVGKENDQ